MSLFSSFLVLLLILVEAAPPTATSVPKLGQYSNRFTSIQLVNEVHYSNSIKNSSRRICLQFSHGRCGRNIFTAHEYMFICVSTASGLYYCFNMVIIMLSIFLSSLVVNVNKLGDGRRTMPRCLKIVSFILKLHNCFLYHHFLPGSFNLVSSFFN